MSRSTKPVLPCTLYVLAGLPYNGLTKPETPHYVFSKQVTHGNGTKLKNCKSNLQVTFPKATTGISFLCFLMKTFY